MNYYKTADNQVYAYEETQMDWVKENNKVAELKLVEISESEAAAIANPPPTKEQRIEAAVAALNGEKEEKLNTLKVRYQDANYDADERSQTRIIGAVTLLSQAPAGAAQSWIDADNTERELTAADLAAIGALIAREITSITLEYRAKKDAVLAEVGAEQ
jgi:hypothetical protein